MTKKIICDTNIWYNFANGKIKKESLENPYLIATYINLVELAQTPNMTKNLVLYINTLKAIKENHSAVIKSNPYEHIVKLFFPDFIPDYSLANKITSGIEVYINNIEPETIPKNVIEKVNKEIREIKDFKNSLSDPINNGLQEIRKSIKANGGKKERKKKNTIKSWKQFISDTVYYYSKENLDKEYSIDLNDRSWDLLELLLLTFEDYFLELELSGNRKFDSNDWGDLLNLAYVQPNKLYWTYENKWNNLFMKNKFLKKYIYRNNATQQKT